VAELWELFLLHCLTTACDQTVTHGTTANVTKHLLHSTRDPSKVMGRLYPDFTVGDLTSPTAIIDAKYKRLTDPFPVAREDLYQLTSYLTAYANNTQPPRGMLAYPLLPDSAPSTAESNGPWSLQAKNVAQVDFMRLPTTEKECTARFAELLAETRY
jgi:5-methylcytosine-specific restriction enzyme subunit McrC